MLKTLIQGTCIGFMIGGAICALIGGAILKDANIANSGMYLLMGSSAIRVIAA